MSGDGDSAELLHGVTSVQARLDYTAPSLRGPAFLTADEELPLFPVGGERG